MFPCSFQTFQDEKETMMSDVCDKDLYNLKILKVIDYINHVSKKKPTKERILKYTARNNLKLQENVFKILLDNLKEGILETRADDSSQCFYLKETIESYTKKRQKATEIIDSREDDIQSRPCQIKTSLVI